MMIEVTGDKGNIDVPAFTDRLAVIDRFQHSQPARMSLNRPRHRIKKTRSRMRSKRLPFGERGTRSLDSGVYIRRGALRYSRNFFAGRGIDGVEISCRRWFAPFAINKMAETPPVAIQPGQRLFWIFSRRPVFHAYEFFCNAHQFITPSDADILPNTCPSQNVPVAARCRSKVHWPQSEDR